ncbi:ABC transporter permease [Lysinibacillus sp. LZ02]|uniref:ABC transporter permease n=1 Tax=Lysinibacillus sp. LZ02 TaxID=3420668 RepID=UPI003D3614D6
MSKFSVLLKQLYKQKIKSKTFIFSTAFYLLLIVGVTFWPEIKGLFTDEDRPADIVALYNHTESNVTEHFHDSSDLVYETIPDMQAIDQSLEDGEYVAAIELSETEGKLAAQIYSYDPLTFSIQQQLTDSIETAAQLFSIGQLNLTDEQAALLLDTTPLIGMTTVNVVENEGKSTEEKMAGMLGSYAAGIIIYIIVISFLSIITTDVASEKGSRALEMLLVSVKPETHFRSKVFGVFLIALTQFTIILAVLFGLLRFTDDGAKWDMVTSFLGELSVSYYIFVILFLVLTILLYLIIGALFGSLVSKVEEGNQVMMPAMIVIIIAFYVMIAGMNNPDTMLIKVFSYIPFTAGMVMPMRIGGTDMGMMEPIISLAVLGLTVVAVYFLSLSFYKRSVLTYSTGGVIQKIKTVFKVTT